MHSVKPSRRLRAERQQAARYLAHILQTQVRNEEFDMTRFVSACGTVGCMAGHLALHAPRAIQDSYIALMHWKDRERMEVAAARYHYTEAEKHHVALSMVAFEIAKDNMRLEHWEASELFLMLDSTVTRLQAIAVVSNFAKTGKIKWQHRDKPHHGPTA